MEDRKYKHWVFTINEYFEDELYPLEKFLKTLCTSYVFQEEKGEKTGRDHIQGYFQLKIRKRQKSLLNDFHRFYTQHYGGNTAQATECLRHVTISRMLGTQDEAIAYCTKTDTQISKPRTFGLLTQYNASDLKIFDNSATWYPWQKSLMEILFNKDLTLTEPNDRTIIWVQDLMGNSGKSKLVKHICYNYPEETCKLAFGSSTQLRSACIAAGPRKLYFVDVPRTLGKDDDISEIISVIEDIKNGFVVSSMYGKYQQLMFDPPHIVVFANIHCPSGTLSNDRLEQYTIHFDINDEFKKVMTKI